MGEFHTPYDDDVRDARRLAARSRASHAVGRAHERWSIFEQMLHAHHTTEDDLLWPVMRDAVTGGPTTSAPRPDGEGDAAIQPVLEALDRALAHGKPASQAQANLESRLLEHLAHEERDALPLVDQTLTEEQWMTFGQATARRMGPDMPRFLPWLLDGADQDTTTRVSRRSRRQCGSSTSTSGARPSLRSIAGQRTPRSDSR